MNFLQKLKINRSQAILALFVAALIGLSVALAGWRHHRSTPEYALKRIDAINNKADIDGCRAFMTAQGLKIASYALDHQSKGPPTSRVQYGEANIQENICYFPFTQGSVSGYLQFQQRGVWQFDDLVYTRVNDHDVELSLAWAIDHPVLAQGKMLLAGLDWNTVVALALSVLFGQ